jgi:RNA recognition motif-containing protein
VFLVTDLFVANFPYDTQEAELQAIFSRYGDVDSVRIILDRETGSSRGFAFVKMDDNGAAVAVEELNMANFGGRPLRVRLARPLQQRTYPSDPYGLRDRRRPKMRPDEQPLWDSNNGANYRY